MNVRIGWISACASRELGRSVPCSVSARTFESHGTHLSAASIHAITAARLHRSATISSRRLQNCNFSWFISVRRSRGEMYSCRGRLCVCFVSGRIPTLLHGPGCKLGNGWGCIIGWICRPFTGFVAMTT